MTWEDEYRKQEEKLRSDFKRHDFVEVTMEPDYLGAFTTGKAVINQFYKWVEGKYVIRIGTDFPKIFAMQDMTYNIIYYNGAQSWGIFPDIQAVLASDFIQTLINFAENEYNFHKEHENYVDTQKDR